MLAGNVIVTQVGGKLTVTGDNLDNAITINATEVSANDPGTTINSGAGPFAYTGAVTKVAVNMKGGNDDVTVTGLAFTGSASVDMGAGNDTLTITGVTLTGNAAVDMGAGNDTLTISDVTVTGNASIKLGKGNDTLEIDHTSVAKKFDLDDGPGHDTKTFGPGNNIPKLSQPTISITGPSSIDEGSLYTLNLSATTKKKKDDDDHKKAEKITQFTIDWGDGSALQTVNGNPTTATHTFVVDDGVTIIASVTTKDGTFKTELPVTINNVAPTVALNAVSPITENSSATLTGSYTDPSTEDTQTVTVNWGDPNNTAPSVFSVGPVTAALDSGDTAVTAGDTFTSTGADTTSILTINSVNTTTGAVTFSVQHKYRDDGLAPGNGTASDSSTIMVTVEDDDGDSGSNTTTVTVNNVAPTVSSLSAVSPINENGATTLTGTYTDIGLLDAHTVTINWGDPNSAANSVFSIGATSTLSGTPTFTSTGADTTTVLTVTSFNATTGVVNFSVMHTYRDDGLAPGNGTASDISTIAVTVTDDDTGTDTKTTNVTVNNVAPALTLNAFAAPINENGTATLTGSFTDPGLLDAHTLTVNWGDPNNSTNSVFSIPATNTPLATGNTFNSTSGDGAVLTLGPTVNTTTGVINFSVTHTYRDDGLAPGNGTASDISTITVTVNDDDTGTDTKTTNLTVNNVAPTVSLTAFAAPINENSSATLTGSFTDPGLLDAHTVTVNWADPNNTTNSVFALGAINSLVGGGTVTGSDGTVLTIGTVNGTTGAVTFSVPHKYVDDGLSDTNPPGANGTASDISAIVVTVADDDTGSGGATTNLTVNNVAPTIALTNPGPTAPTAFTINGSYTDIGVNDVHTIVITWGDTTSSTFQIRGTSTLTAGNTFFQTAGAPSTLTIDSVTQSTGTVTFHATHTYAPALVVASVGATNTDDDLGAATPAATTGFTTLAPIG